MKFGYYPDGALMALTNATRTNYWTYSDGGGACPICGNAVTNAVTDPLGRVIQDIRSGHGLPLQTVFVAGTNSVGTTEQPLPTLLA